jgi:hypothetical protein
MIIFILAQAAFISFTLADLCKRFPLGPMLPADLICFSAEASLDRLKLQESQLLLRVRPLFSLASALITCLQSYKSYMPTEL